MNDSILKPHQSSGIKWLMERENPKDAEFHGEPMAAGVFSQMKWVWGRPSNRYTMMKNKMKTLIVVPKSLVKQWMDETAKFGSGLNMRYIKDFSDFDPDYDTRDRIVVHIQQSERCDWQYPHTQRSLG